MENAANPAPGAESLSLGQAAQKISGILGSKPEKPKAEAKPEKQEVPSQEVEQTETEETSSQEVETESQSTETESTEASEASQQTEFERLEELAEALEMPLDKFLSKVKAKVKISGEEKEVTLDELRNGYQMESDYRRKTSELSEQRKAFEAERERIATEVKGRLTEAAQMAQYFEQQLMAEYNAVNWTELRQTNPAEYAALQQDYNNRYQQLTNNKQRMALEAQRIQHEEQSKQVESFKQNLKKEQEQLVALMPDFGDETKAKALKSQMRDFLKSNGFRDEEINQVYDHRHVLMIGYAMKYKALQSKKPEIANKVKEAPKLSRPGAKSSSDPNQAVVKELRARLRKSGNVRDAAALLKGRL
jgi:hypothetical protein